MVFWYSTSEDVDSGGIIVAIIIIKVVCIMFFSPHLAHLRETEYQEYRSIQCNPIKHYHKPWLRKNYTVESRFLPQYQQVNITTFMGRGFIAAQLY